MTYIHQIHKKGVYVRNLILSSAHGYKVIVITSVHVLKGNCTVNLTSKKHKPNLLQAATSAVNCNNFRSAPPAAARAEHPEKRPSSSPASHPTRRLYNTHRTLGGGKRVPSVPYRYRKSRDIILFLFI